MKDLLATLKQNSPKFYEYVMTQKRISLITQLDQLRKLYPTSDVKEKLKQEAENIKSELKKLENLEPSSFGRPVGATSTTTDV